MRYTVAYNQLQFDTFGNFWPIAKDFGNFRKLERNRWHVCCLFGAVSPFFLALCVHYVYGLLSFQNKYMEVMARWYYGYSIHFSNC
jgi:hypothetical protein